VKALPALLLALAPGLALAQEVRRDRFREGLTRFQGKIQDVIPEDLDRDGRRDLVVTHTSFAHDGKATPTRYISVKWHDAGAAPDGKPEQTWEVPDEAATLMFGDYTEAAGIEIGYLAPTGMFAWELNGRRYGLEAKRVILAETFFDVPQDDSLPLWWWPLDIDSNGLTDVLLPQSDAYRLYVQTAPGKYGMAFTLSMRTASKAAEHGSAFLRVIKQLPRVETQDVNGDWRQDVCLVWKDRFAFYLQGAEGSNGKERMTFPREPSGEITLQFLQQKEKKDHIATAITYLKDLNRGGGVDFIASYTAGDLSKIDAIATDYYMYLGNGGRPLPGIKPDWRIKLPGLSYNPQIEDLNGDGFDDIVVSSFETSMLSNAGKVVFQKVPIDYYVYLFSREKQAFSADYDYKETTYVDIDKLGKGGGMPQLKFNGDWDGDGRKDVLRLDSDGWLSAAKGISVKTLLKNAPVEFEKTDIFRINIDDRDEKGETDAPDGVEVWELNGDGKADVVLRWSARVKVLVTR
jgi:hypothetical protein